VFKRGNGPSQILRERLLLRKRPTRRSKERRAGSRVREKTMTFSMPGRCRRGKVTWPSKRGLASGLKMPTIVGKKKNDFDISCNSGRDPRLPWKGKKQRDEDVQRDAAHLGKTGTGGRGNPCHTRITNYRGGKTFRDQEKRLSGLGGGEGGGGRKGCQTTELKHHRCVASSMISKRGVHEEEVPSSWGTGGACTKKCLGKSRQPKGNRAVTTVWKNGIEHCLEKGPHDENRRCG